MIYIGYLLMKHLKLALILTWFSLASVISPVWIGFVYMNITGHGKGYGYDMGSEADIAAFGGVISLLLWAAAVLPAMLWLCRQSSAHKKGYGYIPLVGFAALFCVGILIIGWGEFIKLFGFGYSL